MDIQSKTAELEAESPHITRILIERIRVLYATGFLAVMALYVSALILVLLLDSHLPSDVLYSWAKALIVVGAFRLFLWFTFRKQESMLGYTTWLNLHLLISFCVGLTWAAATFFFIPLLNTELQLTFTIVLFAYLSGTMTTQYPFLAAFLVVFAPPGLAFLYVAFSEQSQALYTVGLMFVVFSLFVFAMSRRMRHSLLVSLRLQLENEALTDNLQMQREGTESLHHSLDEEIKARKHVELGLIEARDEATRAKTAKSEFLGIISHEIRTPMNGIVGLCSLLRDTELTDEQREYLDLIDQSSDDMMYLVNNILEYTDLMSNSQPITNGGCIPAEIVDQVTQAYATNAADKSLYLKKECAPGAREMCQGRPDSVSKVLSTLVNNAVKFTDHGGITVWVDTQRGEDGRLYSRFEVEDTGLGIDETSLKELFEGFVQADPSTTREHGGAGLGLALCKLRVEAMGGQIGARSEPGKGSTFWFVLPIREKH